jgi:alpha-beta hydrolase superfamily lysophospholipase
LHVPTSWGTVRVQIFGDRSENRKAIIALHGYLDNSNSFLPLSNFLVDHGYFIAAIDAPGHGLRYFFSKIYKNHFKRD